MLVHFNISARTAFLRGTAVLKGRRQYLTFLRAAQGSRTAPLLWARLAALVMRFIKSLFTADEVNLLCFLDGPLAAIKVIAMERNIRAATIILVWGALDFKLAYRKGQLGQTVAWIGGN